MKHKRFILIILLAGVFSTFIIGISVMSQTKPKEVNLVMEEMIALAPAFKTIIDAVVLGDMKMIKPALIGVHEARDKVEKAVKAGQKIDLPKNKDKFKEFVKLDDKFHEDFESLAKAAETGKKKLVKDQTHKLLDACVVCHERFRK